MGGHTLSSLELSVVPNIADGALQLSVKGGYQPRFVSVIGIGTFEVGAQSKVNWSRTKLEIALAFDLSSSMLQQVGGMSRVDAAKEAAHELVDILFEAVGTSDPERLKISVVPYTSVVNVGTEYQNASWSTPTDCRAFIGRTSTNQPARPRASLCSIGWAKPGAAVSRPGPAPLG